MPRLDDPIELTPTEFELAVKSILDGSGVGLEDYNSAHLEDIPGMDGVYTFDVTARFTALGAKFLVLIECKHLRRRVERQAVQVLHAKMHSTGAQKGMLFSTAGFQAGAIEYADIHGIALVHVADGSSAWLTKSMDRDVPRPTSPAETIGWWCHGNSMSVMSAEIGEYTRQALGLAVGDC